MRIKILLAERKEEERMAEEQKKTLEDFRTFFEGTPCAEMMRKMMEGKKEGQRFSCVEMMPQMTQWFCGAKEKKEASSKETKEAQPPHS
jgi:hypothetical protein